MKNNRIKKSDKRDAEWHRNVYDRNKEFNVFQKEFYLGDNTLKKMAVMYREFFGQTMNLSNVDRHKASEIVSFCINHCFNEFFSKQGSESVDHDLPVRIETAFTPEGRELYDKYQYARGYFDRLMTGDSDKEKIRSAVEKLNKAEIPPLGLIRFEGGGNWTPDMVEWLLDASNLNDTIKDYNLGDKAAEF